MAGELTVTEFRRLMTLDLERYESEMKERYGATQRFTLVDWYVGLAAWKGLEMREGK